MAEKKHEQSSFTVTDRRLFTSEGELRSEAPEEEDRGARRRRQRAQRRAGSGRNRDSPSTGGSRSAGSRKIGKCPSRRLSAEQEAQAAAYSSRPKIWIRRSN